MYKKQTAVSHSSRISEIISLDTGLRLDGLPAEIMGSYCSYVWKRVFDFQIEQGDLLMLMLKQIKSQKKIIVIGNILQSNVQYSRQEALLHVFEDNETVIEMIINGRNVALDWLFDRINLDSKIQITYIDTKNQLANILTKGNFTRDEWYHLLC